MSPKKLSGIVLLVLGVVLLLVGFNATEAPVEEVTEAFTGRYSDATMLYLIGGAVAALVGLVLLLKK